MAVDEAGPVTLGNISNSCSSPSAVPLELRMRQRGMGQFLDEVRPEEEEGKSSWRERTCSHS